MHRVAKTLANLFADVLPQADDKARRSHLDNLPIVWHAVKGGMDRQPSFPKEYLDVVRHFNVGGIHPFILQDDGIEFVLLIGWIGHVICVEPFDSAKIGKTKDSKIVSSSK